ncbi:MAG: diadenylate cyclase [Desulfobacterales bacterium]|nr:diadenylate cyclase [Desulfobacterales bacterium]
MEILWSPFFGFRWQDGLDILLNTYIIFRLYVLFRGTHVIRGLLGILILWGAGQAAVSLGLIVTNWVMQGVIAVAALIVIVVFRNEISGVFQTRSFRSFFWGIPQYQHQTPVDIIAASVHELARKKIGALMVLPLKQGLDSTVQGGVRLDGTLSRKMLVSLFWPGSPLHDGAAVIQGDRIVTGGAILPLSQRRDLPPDFGTRHRAASGLAELTDALVIVVSEERGEITVFRGLEIHHLDDGTELETFLQEHAGGDTAEKGVLGQSLELALVGIIALVCVTGLWARFSKGMETLAQHQIPLDFVNPDQKMEIISSSASSVNLVISGARPLIQSLNPEQMKIRLNLSQSVVGKNQLAISRSNIQLPPGIHLKEIEPTELTVVLDTLVEKELPVQPNWVGKLEGELVMKAAIPHPGTVVVRGGGMALKDVTTVFTEPIPLDELTGSGEVSVDLALDPTQVKWAESPRVRIDYIIVKKRGG